MTQNEYCTNSTISVKLLQLMKNNGYIAEIIACLQGLKTLAESKL